ncbi:MAG TPA: hypothetical protein GXX28_05560 [Firmicutes bacterium]|nr:hypothetical protein [Bacillota bacterium]
MYHPETRRIFTDNILKSGSSEEVKIASDIAHATAQIAAVTEESAAGAEEVSASA